MGEARDAAALVRVLEDGVRVLLPDLLRLAQAQQDEVAAEGLVRVLGVGGVPVPLRVPVEDAPRRRDGIVSPGDAGQVLRGVLDLAAPHVGQHGQHGQAVVHHAVVHARDRLGGASAAAVAVHVARVPARRRVVGRGREDRGSLAPRGGRGGLAGGGVADGDRDARARRLQVAAVVHGADEDVVGSVRGRREREGPGLAALGRAPGAPAVRRHLDPGDEAGGLVGGGAPQDERGGGGHGGAARGRRDLGDGGGPVGRGRGRQEAGLQCRGLDAHVGEQVHGGLLQVGAGPAVESRGPLGRPGGEDERAAGPPVEGQGHGRLREADEPGGPRVVVRVPLPFRGGAHGARPDLAPPQRRDVRRVAPEAQASLGCRDLQAVEGRLALRRLGRAVDPRPLTRLRAAAEEGEVNRGLLARDEAVPGPLDAAALRVRPVADVVRGEEDLVAGEQLPAPGDVGARRVAHVVAVALEPPRQGAVGGGPAPAQGGVGDLEEDVRGSPVIADHEDDAARPARRAPSPARLAT